MCFLLNLFTEKSVQLIEKNQYIFLVSSKITKQQAKLIIEKMYNLPIQSIRSLCLQKTKKRIGGVASKKNYKKVIVRFRNKKSINFFTK